ncbi:MAG: 50S ribosomal protein L30e [Candidatus Thermoplasmatota archaeon]|jgi:large subunit ribosomal protein L30e|nr:50S ribosomal protein L30e [Candidatus Thermoplasmatota archaeon]
MVEVDRILKDTIKNGKVKIGTKETKSALKKDSVKLVVIANNCPNSKDLIDLAMKKKVPVYNYHSNSIDLGYICGKSFGVSVFAVIDDGGANILNLVKKG